MHKNTVVDQIEVLRNSTVQIRLTKEIVDDDGVTVVSSQYHRTIITADTDFDEQISAVNTHLAVSLGYPEITEIHITRLRSFVDLARS